jgi:hypothetical protein
MKTKILVIILLFSLNAVSQNEEIFKMKKEETGSIIVDKNYTSDAIIDISDQKPLSSLSISGKINLIDSKSLVRIILVTKEHEYLVFEAYKLIADDLNFSLNKVCDETSLLENEVPVELILIVRNAELELKEINVSNMELNSSEKKSFVSLKNEYKKQVEKYKSLKINKNNSNKNKTWIADATKLSRIPFEGKKRIFGGNNDFMLSGFEYYSDGIFSFEDFNAEEKNSLKSVESDLYVPEFDWRSRHGQNWNTSVKFQNYPTECGSCAAHCCLAVIEAMMNIYYNNPDLDLDLSEQEIVSCSGTVNCSGGDDGAALQYIQDYGIVDEVTFPYSATEEPCPINFPPPSSEIVKIESSGSVSNSSNSETSMKSALIHKGPITSTLVFRLMNPDGSFNSQVNHCIELCGYHKISLGETILTVDANGDGVYVVVDEENPLKDETFWIFKNSMGTEDNDRPNGGYTYLFTDKPSILSAGYYVVNPYSSTSYIHNCTDNDHDGYYWWGLGPKPSTCHCCPDLADGDDSDPTKGPIDEYGNFILPFSPYVIAEHQITSVETWTGIHTECADLVVKTSGTLIINDATINMGGNTFSVEVGGELTLEKGDNLTINSGTMP